MKYVLIGVLALFVFVAAGAIAHRFLGAPGRNVGGFRDWVKNPSYKEAAAAYFAARESLEVPEDISDAEIQQMVDRLFVPEDEDFNFHRLKLVGARAAPFLIAALEKPQAAEKFPESVRTFHVRSPFQRICDLLKPLAPTEAARPLAKHLDHPDDHFRKHAALTLGAIGSGECLEPMLKALADDDASVRSFAMMGVLRGIQAGRCTQDFREGVFPAIIQLLDQDDPAFSDKTPDLLLALDADRALTILLAPKYFTIENPQVHFILRALNAAGHKIPRPVLLPFLESVRPLANEYPYDYACAEALLAYAHNPDASAEETLRAELQSPNERVQAAAAEGLAVLAGVVDAWKVVLDAVNRSGFESLSPPQKHYYAVTVYNGEANNGGHAQYFVNSSGDHWKWAREGLQAIGATARAAILQEALALFGAAGPSEDSDTRHRQLARFSQRQDRSLSELDDKYYACTESIEVLLAQYALQYKEHFAAR